VTRENLATDLSAALREAIVHGALTAGQRINEVHWAAEQDVSRTPLREALCRLAAEGFVENRPRRGFFVPDPDPADAADLYAIRAILDPAALEMAGLPDAARIDRLARINARIAAADHVERAIDLDDAWHLELVSHCGNRVLLDLVRQFMQRTRPLERAYVGERRNVPRMVAEHERILAALRQADLPSAVGRLRANLRSGLDTIRGMGR